MSDLADLFPGFQSHWVDTSEGRLFARSGGTGPALLLLHGYPQTHVNWHKIAPLLAERFTLVIPDLPGYGWSFVPQPADDHAPHSKRAWGALMVELMEKLGHARFAVAGHDRGGRVAYRLALDEPGRVSALAVLDIVPTGAMWAGMDMRLAMKTYHWMFLAQPHPLPETLIVPQSDFYLDWTLASWTKARSLDAFDRWALDHYRAFFKAPERVRSACEDYRAGATIDRLLDEGDLAAGRQISAPLLALWGAAGIPSETSGPLDTWRRYARSVSGQAIDSGHFVTEENPQATAQALVPFLLEHAR